MENGEENSNVSGNVSKGLHLEVGRVRRRYSQHWEAAKGSGRLSSGGGYWRREEIRQQGGSRAQPEWLSVFTSSSMLMVLIHSSLLVQY